MRKAATTYHAWVKLYGHHLLGLLQELHGQVTCAWPNFKHHIRGLHPRLVHNGLHNQRVLQNVLALAFVELEAW